MDGWSSRPVGGNARNSQESYRSSMAFQLQQPNADRAAADGAVQSAVAASQRASMEAAAIQQGFNTSPLLPPTPPTSLASPVVPVSPTAVNTAAAIQRASATAAAAAASRSRQSAMLNGTAASQPPAHRTSMLVQLQQPTANGGSIVQPVREIDRFKSNQIKSNLFFSSRK